VELEAPVFSLGEDAVQYKIYAESFVGREHLARVQDEARALVAAVLAR